MDRERLVQASLGQLNKGLLVFRLGLYSAVAYALIERGAGGSALLAVALVAFIPAVPRLPWKIEIGVTTTLLLELVLTLVFGVSPALQIMAMFSVAVAGLFLTRRAAVVVNALAIVLQAIVIVVFLADALPEGAQLSDLLAETVLLLASGLGFIGIGGVLRGYQGQLIEQAQEEIRLTELIESKDQLIDTIAHEIRTPVTAVLGLSSELSSMRLLDVDEVGEIATLVASESRRLAHLVDNLVLRSRSGIDRLTFRSEELRLEPLLRSSWRVLGLDADELIIEDDATVVGDRERLQHIFVNLFDNSIRHGRLPATVTISTADSTALLRFSDDGPGLDVGMSALALEVYGGRRDRHRPDHVGLGLPVSRMLVEHMSGELRVEDEGVVVTLPVPAVVAAPA